MSSIDCIECGKPNSEFNLRCTRCRARLSGTPSTLPLGGGEDMCEDVEALIGQSLSVYRIEGCLGRGSMGVVYRALDLSRSRHVALKLLAPAFVAEPSIRARFRREARAAAGLDHPGIAQVHAIEEHDGQPFIVMELCEGQTLDHRIRGGPPPLPEAMGLLRQIASGLAVAHAAGVLHRDLKPSNVMLTRQGEVKLLDFGLAKLLDRESSSTGLTQTGQILGTLAYMSPEQIRAEPLDPRTDLWSAGVVAYEMLAGRRPFLGLTGAALMDGILMREPVPVGELRPEVPAALERLVQRMLCKARQQRIGSAEEVLEILDRQAAS
jgi:eukaryotic-like serine/threonine-protein kinase